MSGGLGLGVLGAVAGAFIPGVGPLLGYAIGSAIGGILFAPKINTEGPRLTDLSIQSSAEGQPIYKIYGAMRTAGNVIWGKPLVEKRKTKKSGGKGGGGGKTRTYSYTVDFAVALCEGPVTAIRKIWADGKLIYDMSVLTPAEQAIVDAGGFVPNVISRVQSSTSKTSNIVDVGGTMRIYTGTETQLPDPLIESDLGAGNTPAFRGTCYIVFDNFKLADFGNRIPNITAEVVASGDTAVQYLGFQQLQQTAIPGGNTHFDSATMYMKGDRIIGAASWADDWNGLAGVADPFIIYPSGSQTIGPRITLSPASENGYIAGNSDPPALFVTEPSAGGGRLRFYTFSGNPPSLIFAARYRDETQATGFNDLRNNALSRAFLVDGTFWIYRASTDRLFKSALQYFAAPESSDVAAVTYHAALSTLASGAFRGMAIGNAELYLYYTSPHKLSVFDIETLTLSYEVAFTGSTGNVNHGIYSPEDGEIYALWASTTLSKTYLHGVKDGIYKYYGELPGIGNAIADHEGGNQWSLHDGILVIKQNEQFHYFSVDSVSGSAVPLSTIVADICNSAGLDSSFVNVTDLASTMVNGYIRNAQMTARSALEPLASGFFFDAVESADKIVFKHRGSASVATIDYDDLGAASEGTQEDRVVTSITQDNELPIELNMQYTDPARDFQIGSQRSRRQIPKSQKIDTVQMPIAWSGTEAKQAVEKLHYTAWESRTVHAFSLPLKYLRLEPADVITLPINNVNRRVRLTKTTVGSVIQCEAESDYAASYISESIAAENPAGPQEILAPGTTIMQILDIPILQDADNDAGFYVAAMGTGTGWTGAAIYKSADNVTFDEADVVTVESEMGSATTLLPSGPTTIWDDGNTVTVRLIEGALTSTTDLNAMSGINTLAIGAPGRWEIMSFVNATLNGDGTYTLSRLLRGRLGTEWAVGLHTIGDAVVVLEAGALTRIVPATTDIGVPRYYKAISFGGDEGDVITYTHQAVGLEPYSPVHIRGRRHSPSTNDWTITWVRRTRIDGGWRDYVDVPLGEVSESYEIDIMSGSTVKRTLTATGQTVTYTAAMQTTDFGAVQNTLSVRVYQLGGTTGRGYVASATI